MIVASMTVLQACSAAFLIAVAERTLHLLVGGVLLVIAVLLVAVLRHDLVARRRTLALLRSASSR